MAAFKNRIDIQEDEAAREKYGVDIPLLVFTDMKVVDSSLKTMNDSFESYSNIDPSRTDFKQVMAQSFAAGCTMMVNRALLNLLQETPSGQFMIMHDWWISLIAAGFGHIGYVPQATSLYRQHGDNSIGAKRFSILKAVSVPKKMVSSFRATVQQATSFREIYGDRLDADKLECLSYFVSIGQKGLIPRLFSLFKSDAWKKGARKIGQIYAVLTYRLYHFNS
ncbi:hypothetical protein OZX57_01670 [Bifidobacterium sp. ESL0682]|uniref:hypothetical protein n=1 Tax=Bifidobacterium sp. ESL0682 TaxID=2983212 RepID=UPI0023FA1C66|nr:hypothetical protein [Bifidobacterium sp. ESL0682]WEV42226.1 hypothetical protein OZX57_01670 [Bifidobacterium sp. ESL0682]